MNGFPPVKCCQSCFMLMPSASSMCHACGHDFRDPLKMWDRHDANIWSIVVDGIYYVAARPDKYSLWRIKDGSNGEDVATGLITRDVTSYFKRKAEAEAAARFAEWAKSPERKIENDLAKAIGGDA